MNRLFLIMMVLLGDGSLWGQAPDRPESFDYYLELISEIRSDDEEETSMDDLAYELYDLWESPVNINTAGPDELGRIFWLSELQLNNLIQYLKHQKVLSVYELAYLPGFDSTLVVSLRPFVTISNAAEDGRAYEKSKHWVMLRAGKTMEAQKGFRDGNFDGNAWKENLRYKYQYGEKILAGFSLEKDAGESAFSSQNKAGPDFYSGYLKVNYSGVIKTITAGHYSTGFGQGLVAGPGFAMGKTTLAANPVQKESGIRPYTSNDENRYLQGIAATVSLKPVDVSLFFSLKHMDANVTLRNETGNVLRVSSLQNTGVHSTASEISDEDVLREITAGGRVILRRTKFQAGLTFIHSAFSSEIVPQPENYNQFYFRGRVQTNVGADYKFNFGNTILFGEEALDSQGDPAFLNGVTSDIGGRLQFSLLHRYYARGYHAFYGKAFGENSRVQNEEGIYAGCRLSLLRNITLSLYADFFRFPWRTSSSAAPTYGREFMVQAEYSPSAAFSGYIQYRPKQKQMNSPVSSDPARSLVISATDRWRFHGSYKASENFILSSRLELGSSGIERQRKDRSYLLFQDIRLQLSRPRIQLSLRYALFHSDQYNCRIYAFENDFAYSWSVNVYDKQGQRYYAMVKYSPCERIDLWIRYSQTVYPREKSISEGLWQIEGNQKSDVKMQVVWKFQGR